MKLLCWESLGCFMANLLPNSWSWTDEMTTLSVVNQSQGIMEDNIGCCSINWLLQLQQTSCPLVKILILGLVALPVYNTILILVGWRLNSSASSSAERMVLDIRVAGAVKRPAPPPPAAPRPPPRLRRRKAPKTADPKRKLRLTEAQPSQKNPFDSTLQRSRDQEDQTDQYKDLRENLKLVLENLQKPLPLPLPPSPLLPIFVPPEVEPLTPPESVTPPGSPTPPESPRMEMEKRRSKFLPGILKRLGLNTLWQRWKTRTSKKKTTTSEASTSSSSCSSTGSSCFYVY